MEKEEEKLPVKKEKQSRAPRRKKEQRFTKPDGSMIYTRMPTDDVSKDTPQQEMVKTINQLITTTHFLSEKVQTLYNKQTKKNVTSPLNGKTADQLVFELASMGCTMEEVATLLGVTSKSIWNNYQEIFEFGREHTKMSVRRKQLERAIEGKGDTTMLIWLGKQLLGQKDQPQTQVNIQNNVDTSGVKEKLKVLLKDDSKATIIDGVVTPEDNNNE